MSYTVYSFDDVTMTISHPQIGQYVVRGAGIGSITTTMATDRTAHDISADGQVMVSKIRGRNGSHAIAVQQVSTLHKWLLKLYNYLEQATASHWANITIVIQANSMGETITSTGVSFQKLPDKPYQAQGQQVTWQLMAADIQQDSL